MSGARATAVERSIDDQIQDVILDIARNRAGLNWWDYRAGSEPRVKDIRGYPFLVVRADGHVGSMRAGEFVRGALEREPGISEPVYQWTIQGLWPFRPENPITDRTAQDALRRLLQAFTLEWTADGTADALDIESSTIGEIPGAGGYRWYGITLVLTAVQQILATYNP